MVLLLCWPCMHEYAVRQYLLVYVNRFAASRSYPDVPGALAWGNMLKSACLLAERSLRRHRCPQHVAGRQVAQAVLFLDGRALRALPAARRACMPRITLHFIPSNAIIMLCASLCA